MRIHVLKTWSPWFEDTRDGKKPWELRWNDRNYQTGDYLVLRQFVPTGLCQLSLVENQHPSGKWGEEYVVMRVALVARHLPQIQEQLVVMTLADVSDREFIEVMGQVTKENAGGIWSGVGALGVR